MTIFCFNEVTPGGLLHRASHQKDRAMFQSLGLSVRLLPPPHPLEKGRGKGLEIKLIIYCAYVKI